MSRFSPKERVAMLESDAFWWGITALLFLGALALTVRVRWDYIRLEFYGHVFESGTPKENEDADEQV